MKGIIRRWKKAEKKSWIMYGEKNGETKDSKTVLNPSSNRDLDSWLDNVLVW